MVFSKPIQTFIILTVGLASCGDDSAPNIVDDRPNSEPLVEAQAEPSPEAKAESEASAKPTSAKPGSFERDEVRPDSGQGVARINPCEAELSPLAKQTMDELVLVTDAATCADAVEVLSKSRTIDLSGKNIYDLSPLAYFVDVEHLIIADTHVDDLSALVYLKSLKSLDLSRTAVRDLGVLSEHPHLTTVVAVDVPEVSPAEVEQIASVKNIYVADGLPISSQEPIEDEPLVDLSCRTGTWFSDDYKSCRHKSHGVELYKKLRSNWCGKGKEIVTRYKECRHSKHGWEGWDEKEITLRGWWGTWTNIGHSRHDLPEAKCQALIKEWGVRERSKRSSAGYELDYLSHKRYNEISRAGMIPMYAAKDLKCIVKFRERYGKKKRSSHCGPEATSIEYPSCRHAKHPVESYNVKVSSACGTAGKPRYTSSVSAQEFNQKSKPLYCADCSQIAVVDAASAAKKTACLKQVLASDDQAAREISRSAAQVLLDTKAPWLELGTFKDVLTVF